MWSPTHVQVTVQRARNLQNKGRKGTNDAFVLIQMGKEKFQTTIQEKTTDPEWREECDLTLIGRDSDVLFTVYHRNILGLDEFLGQVSVSLQGIESFDRPFTKWYPLQGKSEKSEDKYRGELEVRIAFIVRRCNDTQSLNDLSFKKKKHSIKSLATSVGHKIQKFPHRTMSLRNLDPRKRLERLREKRLSSSSEDPDGLPEEDEDKEVFQQMPIRRNSPVYSSTLSLPQSAMITSSIQEVESAEELHHEEETENVYGSSNSVESQKATISKPPMTKSIFSPSETQLNHGEWTNRIFSHAKGSPIARSETNLMDALRSEVPLAPLRKNRFETLRSNLRRHTLHLSESPDLPLSSPKKNRLDSKPESPKNNKYSIPEGIPDAVLQQYEKMNHKDLVLLVIKQQAELERKRDKIADLENYLDDLLVRVMETTPRILQKPYERAAFLR